MRKLGAACLSLAFLADALHGQKIGLAAGEPVSVSPISAPSAPDYGTADLVSVVVGATDFVPLNDSIDYTTESIDAIFRYQTGPPSVDWWRSVKLPNGAIIESVNLHACDTSTAGELAFGLARMDEAGGSGGNVTPIGSTGTLATPGCAFFSVTPTTPPLVVDNEDHTYLLFFGFSGDFSDGLKAGGIRVFYRLQVSPAPTTATFTDVPTGHPFFRFVEALASAGITGGCGGGQYCPDFPVTRGQMAVFLSIALGLHFPN
jgi:hypothetical protein